MESTIPNEFTNKTVLITGGLGGIGYKVCEKVLEQNCLNVVILDIYDETDKIKELQLKYTKLAKIQYFKTDICNKPEVEQTFTLILNEFKTIDIIINAVGILKDNDIQQTMNVNFLGVVNVILTGMKSMSKSVNNGKGGIIATIASVAAFTPFYGMPIYTASKYAVLGFIGALSNDYYWNRHGIKFLTVCPGAVDTPIRWNIDQRLLFPDMGSLIAKELEVLPVSTPSEMATKIIHIINNGENGSVWIADVNRLESIEFVQHWP